MQHHSLRSILGILLVAAIAGTAWGGTTGKIRGKITDKANGEGLVGASIVIQTTTMGAKSDIDGEFTILNVPPGVYSVQASYVGYETVLKSNVRVTVDLTTVVDFRPESQLIPGPTIEIVVQAPLVNKSATNFERPLGPTRSSNCRCASFATFSRRLPALSSRGATIMCAAAGSRKRPSTLTVCS